MSCSSSQWFSIKIKKIDKQTGEHFDENEDLNYEKRECSSATIARGLSLRHEGYFLGHIFSLLFKWTPRSLDPAVSSRMAHKPSDGCQRHFKLYLLSLFVR